MEAYLLCEKNISMIESIVIDKIFKICGVGLNRQDPFFQENMMMVASVVIKDELKTSRVFDNKTVLKINNIVISECVSHIVGLVTAEPEKKSSMIESLSDEEEVEDDYFEELKKDSVDNDEKIELKPVFNEHVLIFDEEVTKTSLRNVVSVEVESVSIDFSDYIINEKNNSFCINNVEKTVPIGNYTVNQLIDSLNSITNQECSFKMENLTDTVCIYQHKSDRKSMTGAIKEKENQKQINIDFGVKNSINKVLGFLPKTYILSSSDLHAEVKHMIKHPSSIELSVGFTDTQSSKFTILTDVVYNNTIHYRPSISSKILLGVDCTVEEVTIKTEYNTRGRPYIVVVKFITMG